MTRPISNGGCCPIKERCDLPTRLGMLTPVNFADPALAPYVWRQLLTALGVQLEPEEVAQPTAADWHLAHPYPMQPNFTGRKAERATLTTWLNAGKEPLLVLRALGGFGKSALSWYWLTHDIDPYTWPRVVFWSFYEGDASFDRFLSETLAYLSGGQVTNAPQGRPAVDALIRHLQQPGTLLILDGFERQLRAFSGMNAAYRGDETPPQPSPNWGLPLPTSRKSGVKVRQERRKGVRLVMKIGLNRCPLGIQSRSTGLVEHK